MKGRNLSLAFQTGWKRQPGEDSSLCGVFSMVYEQNRQKIYASGSIDRFGLMQTAGEDGQLTVFCHFRLVAWPRRDGTETLGYSGEKLSLSVSTHYRTAQ